MLKAGPKPTGDTRRPLRGAQMDFQDDLHWMPSDLVTELLRQIDTWESNSQWPSALLAGFAHPLPKKADAQYVGDYRPIIIYSTIYRSWASFRARAILRHLSTFVDGHQFGFLPGYEAAEIWLLLQGLIENAHLHGDVRCGFVTDIIKAFESLPRDPVYFLCEWLGVPPRVLGLWKSFLNNMTRRFRLGDSVGDSLQSTSGFPEGCAMSCVAMGMVDLSFHI